MKRILFLLLAVIQCSTTQTVDNSHKTAMDNLIERYKGNIGIKLAVLPFQENAEKQTVEEKQVYSQTFDAVFSSNKFKIVERELLSRLLQENALAQKGITNTSAREVGKLAGADAILISVEEGNRYNFRIVEVQTGEILSYATMKGEEVAVSERKAISILNNKYNCKLKLFEGADLVPDQSKRIYTTNFVSKNTRYIYVDANCAIVDGTANESVNLFFKYFDSENSLINQNKHPLNVDVSWGNFGYTSGWGYAKKSTWEPGEYKIQFFINDEKLDEKNFTIK